MKKIDPYDPFEPPQTERPSPVRINPEWKDVPQTKQDGVIALIERRIRDTVRLINDGIGPQTELREEVAALVAARDLLWKNR